jgi:mono/diheme cytochrome c family protein
MRIRLFQLIVILFFMAFVSACGGSSQAGSSSTQGSEGKGEQLFTANCSTCHGVGRARLPLTTSEFVGQLSMRSYWLSSNRAAWLMICSIQPV